VGASILCGNEANPSFEGKAQSKALSAV